TLPRLSNLKIDHVALARIDAEQSASATDLIADPLTAEVARIFERALGTTGATPDDNVASLGGDSLHAVSVIVALESRFQMAIPLEIFGSTKTIRDLAGWIASQKGAIASELIWQPSTEMLAAEINTSFEQRCSPRFEQGSVAAWIEAVTYQMFIGQTEVAEHGLRYLRERFPTVTYTNHVGRVFDRFPFAGTPLQFKDDPAKDIQIVVNDQTETVLLLFCGTDDNLGLPLTAVHSWTGRLHASLIYLRDFHRRYFLDGVFSLGATRDTTIAELRRV